MKTFRPTLNPTQVPSPGKFPSLDPNQPDNSEMIEWLQTQQPQTMEVQPGEHEPDPVGRTVDNDTAKGGKGGRKRKK